MTYKHVTTPGIIAYGTYLLKWNTVLMLSSSSESVGRSVRVNCWKSKVSSCVTIKLYIIILAQVFKIWGTTLLRNTDYDQLNTVFLLGLLYNIVQLFLISILLKKSHIMAQRPNCQRLVQYWNITSIKRSFQHSPAFFFFNLNFIKKDSYHGPEAKMPL